jgi:hypothetical protein
MSTPSTYFSFFISQLCLFYLDSPSESLSSRKVFSYNSRITLYQFITSLIGHFRVTRFRKYLGCIFTKKFFTMNLKFKFIWASYILSGNPKSRIGPRIESGH